MSVQNFAFVVPSAHDFETTCVKLRQAIEAAKWSLLGGYDFGETLASKGFAQPGKIKSFDVCNARHANEMLGADIRVSMCMPCTIAVYVHDGGVSLATIAPGVVLPAVFGETVSGKSELMAGIDAELKGILEAAAN